MDNVSHTLFGMALGQGIPARNAKARSAAVLGSAIASNLPDLDFVFRFFVNDEKVGYLLHHRGYSHTVWMAIPLGFLAGWIATKRYSLQGLRAHWRIYALGCLAVLL